MQGTARVSIVARRCKVYSAAALEAVSALSEPYTQKSIFSNGFLEFTSGLKLAQKSHWGLSGDLDRWDALQLEESR
jgi:hypothetical protein